MSEHFKNCPNFHIKLCVVYSKEVERRLKKMNNQLSGLCSKLDALAEPIPQIDIENITICNLTTDTWQYITTVYIDGVAGTPDTVDSGVACSEPQPFPPDIETIKVCDSVTNTIHEQVWRYTIDPATNVTVSEQIGDVDTLLACSDEEVDLVYTAPVHVCYDNVGVLTQYAVRDRIEYNNTTLTEVTRVTEYSNDGVVWTTVAPVGVATVGACPTICLATPLGLLTNWG